MKSVTIPTGVATAWSGTFRSFVDGDIFRESNIDLNAGDLAERLAYLKDKADAAGYLASSQTWSGSNTFAMGASEVFSVSGDEAAVFNNVTIGGSTSLQDLTVSAGLLVSGVFAPDTETLGDANATLSNSLVHRVPTLTANRVYTLPSGSTQANQLALVIRPRTADAFTVTVRDFATTTMGIISASASGWILCQRSSSASAWKVVGYGGTVTSLDTTV